MDEPFFCYLEQKRVIICYMEQKRDLDRKKKDTCQHGDPGDGNLPIPRGTLSTALLIGATLCIQTMQRRTASDILRR